MFPYKGLTYYSTADAEIFAARDDDVYRIAECLGQLDTRILILHGRTGCGKSSFLRAGLIPFLERPEHGFGFLRESLGDDSAFGSGRVLFLRAGRDPVLKLALAVYTFGARRISVRTPTGPREVDYWSALGGQGSQEEFAGRIAAGGSRRTGGCARAAWEAVA